MKMWIITPFKFRQGRTISQGQSPCYSVSIRTEESIVQGKGFPLLRTGMMDMVPSISTNQNTVSTVPLEPR